MRAESTVCVFTDWVSEPIGPRTRISPDESPREDHTMENLLGVSGNSLTGWWSVSFLLRLVKLSDFSGGSVYIQGPAG